MKNVFPERFSELIKENNYNYEQIAKKLNLKSKGTISKYATGKIQNIDISMIQKIADIFDVSPAWLAGFSDEKKEKK